MKQIIVWIDYDSNEMTHYTDITLRLKTPTTIC